MRKIRFEIAFDGSDYGGWQSQPSGNTVQDVIQARFAKLYEEPVRLFASSRTDAGVHAIGMHAHCSLPDFPELSNEALLHALSKLLPPDIRIRKITDAAPDFHARFSAVGKTYAYVLALEEPLPSHRRYCQYAPKIVDVDAMAKALEYLRGYHSFESLSCKKCSGVVEDYRRTLHWTHLARHEKFLTITITGDSFLYKMVRTIVGLLCEIGKGVCPPEVVYDFFEAHERPVISQTAAGQGLFLVKVHYEPLPDWTTTAQPLPPFLNYL